MGKHEGPYKQGDRKKAEFSKIIVVLATVMWLLVNIFGMTMMVVTLDLTPMVYVIASVDAVMAVCCAVYSSKAKAENMIKLKRIYGTDFEAARGVAADDYDPYHYTPVVDDSPLYENSSIV